MTRAALVVGIDHYPHLSDLGASVADANRVAQVLLRHADGELNFHVATKMATGAGDPISRRDLKDAVVALFAAKGLETALFYFSGHGHVDAVGGYLCASDSHDGDDGLAMNDVVELARESNAQNKIIILDSCHSGAVGAVPRQGNAVTVDEGMTILTASAADQFALEDSQGGVFTNLMLTALQGAAANLLGEVTPASVYAHIDQSLHVLAQRPIFRTNTHRFISLRKVAPLIARDDLLQLPVLFPRDNHVFPLDPSYEPEMAGRPANAAKPDPANVTKFKLLQKYNRHSLLVPVDVPNMWNAAIESKACRLTPIGQHWRRLARDGLF